MTPGSILKFRLPQRWLNNLLTFLIIFLVGGQVLGQNYKSDQDLIQYTDFKKSKFNKRKVSFMLTKSRNPVVRYNPVTLTFGSLMFFYQKVLSPQFSTGCAYEISCSSFSVKCIQRFGIVKGVALSADRLTRCTQFAAIDIHPSDLIVGIHKVKDDPEKYQIKH